MANAIDMTPYLSAPIVDVAGGVALGVALLTAVPKKAPAPVLHAAKALHARTTALQKAWAASYVPNGSTINRRDADHRMDVAWSSLFGRLETYAALPADSYPRAAEAASLSSMVFPEGLRFLKLPYAREWAESHRLLALIHDKKLESKLHSLVGEDFVNEVKAAHKNYGQALSITEARPTPADVAGVQEPLRDLQAAVSDYAMQVVAAANDSPAFVESARAALGPIDQLRAAAARSASPAPAQPTAPARAAALAPPAPPVRAPTPAAANPLPPVTPMSPVPPVPDA